MAGIFKKYIFTAETQRFIKVYVAWMKRNGIWDFQCFDESPDYVALHPGYALKSLPQTINTLCVSAPLRLIKHTGYSSVVEMKRTILARQNDQA